MKSRSGKVAILIIAIVSVGFGLLPSPLVQDANAVSCDDAIKLCEADWNVTDIICGYYGHNSSVCYAAILDSATYCAYLFWYCED